MALVSSLAAYKPLGQQTEPAMEAHDIVCVHTMVGYLKTTGEMFVKNGYGGTESHFGVGGIWGPDKVAGLDGVIWQWQDLRHQADANLEGNHRVISIETADNAPSDPSKCAFWTPKQAVSLVSLIRQLCSKDFHKSCPSSWKCHQGGIPMTLIPDTKPGRRGVAYHRQGVMHSRGYGIGDYLVKGGEKWSLATGKQCPTDPRITQLKNTIIPALPPLQPTTPAQPGLKEDRVIKLVTYGGEIYQSDGMYRKKVPSDPKNPNLRKQALAELIPKYGQPVQIGIGEMSSLAPLDTLIAIWGGDRVDSADAETAGKSAVVMLTQVQKDLEELTELVKGLQPPAEPTS